MLERFFHLKKHNTTLEAEVTAGLTTFMSMCYILTVNPAILATTGMDALSVFTATALSAAIATLIIAFAANLPIALAPGMDLNVLFAYVVVKQMGYTWQFALTASFIVGILYIILSLTRLRHALIRCFPPQLKNSFAAGIGLFITFIGLRSSGIIVDDPMTLIKLGDITSSSSFVTIFGVLLISTMLLYEIKGALLIGILISTMVAVPLGVASFDNIIAPQLFTMPTFNFAFTEFEWNQVLSFDMFVVVVIFLFVDIMGTTGTIISLAAKGNWFDKDGNIPRIRGVFLADSIGTTVGAMVGTSTVTTYIESATGIVDGGKTGLTSFVVAMLFLFSLFFAPILLLVPIQASSAALIVVGIFMLAPISTIDFTDYLYGIPCFFAIVLMPFSWSIADGVVISLIIYIFLALVSGRVKEVSPLAYIVAILSIAKYMFIY